jgi:hypothetical protein
MLPPLLGEEPPDHTQGPCGARHKDAVAAAVGLELHEAGGRAQPLGVRQRRGALDLHHLPHAHDLEQLLERAHRHDLALVHDGDAVAQALGLLHVVGGVEDGGPGLGHPLDGREDVVAGLGIDAESGLVEQEHARGVHQAAGQVEAPLHPP